MDKTTPQNYVEQAMWTECSYPEVLRRLSVADNKVYQAGETPDGYEFAFDGIRLVHMALGLSNEIGELLEAFPQDLLDEKIEVERRLLIREELGDICWYCAGVALVCGVTFDAVMSGATRVPGPVSAKIFTGLIQYSSKISEQAKKHVFYGQAMNKDEVQMSLYAVVACAREVARRFMLDFDQVLADNIAKLRARFPDRFTAAGAINRDKAAEYAAMGGDDK